MSVVAGTLSPHFKACPADGIRTEFGVCRGDPIRHIQDLILGDTFLPKRDAHWLTVSAEDDRHTAFTLDRAANLPGQHLVTLAELIFMTTTGQRLDVFVAVSAGKLYFIAEAEFRTGVEYVLIDICRREDAIVPAVIPTEAPAAVPPAIGAPAQAARATLRLIG